MRFDNKPSIKDVPSYRYVKKNLPFTVRDSMKGEAALYNAAAAIRGVTRQQELRDRAIDAFNAETLYDAHSDTNIVPIKKISIFTRIYNWFLNINFN